MTLLINQTPVELTLESEQTLLEVVTGLRQWASDQGQTIVSLLVDGKALAPSMAAIELDRVVQLELETTPQANGELNRLGVLRDYLELLAAAHTAGRPALLEDLRGEFAAVSEALEGCAIAYGRQWSAQLSTISASWAPSLGSAEAATRLAGELATLWQQSCDPEAALAAELDSIGTLLPELDSLSLAWQRGDDQKALGLVLRLIAALGDLERLVPRVAQRRGNPWSWKEFQGQLQPFLAEIQSALAAQDYVLLGDLIEYEVRPRVQDCHRVLSRDFLLDPRTDLP